jgi:hypothetical protein
VAALTSAARRSVIADACSDYDRGRAPGGAEGTESMTLTKPTKPADAQRIPVTITDAEHPHYGERGWLTGELITFKPTGEKMAKVELENCEHGSDGCFVTKGQVSRRSE